MFSNIWNWLNERWPFSSLFHLAMDEEIPGGSSFSYTLGSAILTVFILQAATGIIQLFYYVPAVDHAYDSINFLRTKVPFGWLINGLHYWGANALIILVSLHILRVFIWGAYKNPRELTWLFGVGLLLTAMGLSFTGGPLSWDQKSYWEAEVGTSIAGAVPVIGDLLKQIWRGGENLGQLTLSRLFIIHTAILPMTLLTLIGAHLTALRRFGSAGPWDKTRRELKGLFWPDQVFKDVLVVTLVIHLLITLTVFAPKPFNGPADPLDSSYIPKPEWNFLFLYEALKFFPGKLEPIGSVGIPALLVLLMIVLPFLDRKPERNPVRRPIAMTFALIIAAILILLTIAGLYSKAVGAETPASSSTPASKSSALQNNSKGAELFQSLGCTSCHRVNNNGGTVGSDLSFEGQQGRTRNWLISQIKNPKANFTNTIMPSYTSLSAQQMDEVVDYLLSLGTKRTKSQIQPIDTSSRKQTPSASLSKAVSPIDSSSAGSTTEKETGPAAKIIGSADRGAELFKRVCSFCHGSEGTDKVPNPGSDDGTVPSLNLIDKELSSQDPQMFAENIDRFIQHGSIPSGPNPQLRMPDFGDNNVLTQPQISNLEAYILYLNGINRTQLLNPGMQPRRFFAIVVPLYILFLLVIAGIYLRLSN
ncbi:MAG: cytochrome b N-terminal domain-containing protein [candidate division Zixibacteria bacterium]|nr:cytochrome b N-terminal domain-containing protein [candidate division Zixibacteria bacterium]